MPVGRRWPIRPAQRRWSPRRDQRRRARSAAFRAWSDQIGSCSQPARRL